jgi:hypothetical protein
MDLGPRELWRGSVAKIVTFEEGAATTRCPLLAALSWTNPARHSGRTMTLARDQTLRSWNAGSNVTLAFPYL